jgi:CheY-like chemotaxis protein
MQRKMCIKQLQMVTFDWEIVSAENVDEALAKLTEAQYQFDIALIDYHLSSKWNESELNGADLIEMMKTKYTREMMRCIIIGMTANKEKNGPAMAYAGADVVWQKPLPKPLALAHQLEQLHHKMESSIYTTYTAIHNGYEAGPRQSPRPRSSPRSLSFSLSHSLSHSDRNPSLIVHPSLKIRRESFSLAAQKKRATESEKSSQRVIKHLQEFTRQIVDEVEVVEVRVCSCASLSLSLSLSFPRSFSRSVCVRMFVYVCMYVYVCMCVCVCVRMMMMMTMMTGRDRWGVCSIPVCIPLPFPRWNS